MSFRPRALCLDSLPGLDRGNAEEEPFEEDGKESTSADSARVDDDATVQGETGTPCDVSSREDWARCVCAYCSKELALRT